MKKRFGIYSRLIAEKEVIELSSVRAVRCVYESEDIQRIEMSLTDANGQVITYSMNSRNGASLIEQLTHAYHAINPQLKTRQNGIVN